MNGKEMPKRSSLFLGLAARSALAAKQTAKTMELLWLVSNIIAFC